MKSWNTTGVASEDQGREPRYAKINGTREPTLRISESTKVLRSKPTKNLYSNDLQNLAKWFRIESTMLLMAARLLDQYEVQEAQEKKKPNVIY